MYTAIINRITFYYGSKHTTRRIASRLRYRFFLGGGTTQDYTSVRFIV